jgi:hypothetical protein
MKTGSMPSISCSSGCVLQREEEAELDGASGQSGAVCGHLWPRGREAMAGESSRGRSDLRARGEGGSSRARGEAEGFGHVSRRVDDVGRVRNWQAGAGTGSLVRAPRRRPPRQRKETTRTWASCAVVCSGKFALSLSPFFSISFCFLILLFCFDLIQNQTILEKSKKFCGHSLNYSRGPHQVSNYLEL